MKVIKHGNRHPEWQSVHLCTTCFAELEVSGSDLYYGEDVFGLGRNRQFFYICPECRHHCYLPPENIPSNVQQVARTYHGPEGG